MTAALSVSGLTAGYGGKPAIDKLSFEVEAGRLVGVVGPNGAGKSTMIKAIMGALPSAGEILVCGKRGKAALRELVYVPQRASVDWDFPLTVRDVVAQGRYGSLGLLKRPSAEDRERVESSLQKVAMAPLADRQIGELSGGQQQRVFLARALAQDGQVYLMDEPFQGVDAATETAIIEVLRTLRAAGHTVVVVHHDLSTVRDYFDEIILLNVQLIAHGTTEEVFVPDMLQRAYGGRLAVFDDGAIVA